MRFKTALYIFLKVYIMNKRVVKTIYKTLCFGPLEHECRKHCPPLPPPKKINNKNTRPVFAGY